MNLLNRIIVNADDFGFSPLVNDAILKSFQRSLITSTSLMANMPGFDDAIRLTGEHHFFEGNVGIHLNLTQGYSLSEEIRRCPRFCDSAGAFLYLRQYPLFFLSGQEQKAIYSELKAQLDRVIAAGIRPSHMDSHHHVHTEWAIVKLVAKLGKEYGIRNIRLTRNLGRQNGYLKKLYKRAFNGWYLKGYAGIKGTDYFGDIDDFRYSFADRPPAGKSIEVMVHPLFDAAGELVDYDQQGLEGKLKGLFEGCNTISYNDL